MPTLQELISNRVKAAESARTATANEVRAIQAAAYTAFLEWAAESIDTGAGGKIEYSAKNLRRVAGVYKIWQRIERGFRKTMLASALRWAKDIVGLNADYFEPDEPKKGVQQLALEKTLLRWGYDVAKGEVLPGGYFETLFETKGVAQKVAALVNRAIAQGMSLSQFQKVFRAAFVGKPGGGMLERHWKTNSFDLFQRIDRTANLIYADELGLNWAIYSGTLEEDSRPFCIARVNRVYSRAQIKSWEGLSFAGKPKVNYDPFTDCGGHNCRHHLSWVSDGVAEKLREKQK